MPNRNRTATNRRIGPRNREPTHESGLDHHGGHVIKRPTLAGVACAAVAAIQWKEDQPAARDTHWHIHALLGRLK
jgi:hypothetical protein